MVFATKAVSIIAGGVAERMKFAPYLIYSFLMCGEFILFIATGFGAVAG